MNDNRAAPGVGGVVPVPEATVQIEQGFRSSGPDIGNIILFNES